VAIVIEALQASLIMAKQPAAMQTASGFKTAVKLLGSTPDLF
jgi:hypothetical protein